MPTLCASGVDFLIRGQYSKHNYCFEGIRVFKKHNFFKKRKNLFNPYLLNFVPHSHKQIFFPSLPLFPTGGEIRRGPFRQRQEEGH